LRTNRYFGNGDLHFKHHIIFKWWKLQYLLIGLGVCLFCLLLNLLFIISVCIMIINI
jgi:hypothetical protein